MERLYEVAVKECQSKEIQVIWGFTDAIKAFRKFGFSEFTSPKLYSRPASNIFLPLLYRFQRSIPLWRKIASVGNFVHYYVRNFVRIYQPKIKIEPGYDITNNQIRVQEFKNFFTKLINSNHSIISIKFDEKFLDWRIRSNPILNYKEYQVTQNRALKAYAFVTLFKGEASISYLGAENNYACQLLLSKIITDYSLKSGRFRLLINPEFEISKNIIRILSVFGFNATETWNLVIRDIGNIEEKALKDISNWNISGLLTEGYSM
jgi:uncharacterized protein YkvS